MKITFEENLKEKEWINKELMHSLTPEVLDKATAERCFDVKLLVNGVELEPIMFNDIVTNVEKYIEHEAKMFIREYLEDAENEAHQLLDAIKEAKGNIIDKFTLDV